MDLFTLVVLIRVVIKKILTNPEVRSIIMAGILSFENIMEAEDITEKTVPVPEWGGDVRVKSISYRRMGKLKASVAESQNKSPDEVKDNDVEMEKAILVAGMVEPEVDEEKADALMDKNAKAVMTVISAIMGSSKNTEKAITEEEKQFPSDS
jgi:hypothetical protein